MPPAYLVYFTVCRVNLNKLSRTLVWAWGKQQLMHQSMRATAGHLQILRCPEAGHLPTPGIFPSFWYARVFLSEYNYTKGYYWKKKADWLICQGQGAVKSCSPFYACISSLLIKPELHGETRELSAWINVFRLVNQISVDIIWRTPFIFITYSYHITLQRSINFMSIILYQY